LPFRLFHYHFAISLSHITPLIISLFAIAILFSRFHTDLADSDIIDIAAAISLMPLLFSFSPTGMIRREAIAEALTGH
jgi:hypothetical protein